MRRKQEKKGLVIIIKEKKTQKKEYIKDAIKENGTDSFHFIGFHKQINKTPMNIINEKSK